MMIDSGTHRDRWSRRDIDMAIGVLMGLRQCPERQAFNEIVAAVDATGVGLGSICRALIALASASTDNFDHRAQVEAIWGEFVGHRTDSRQPAVAAVGGHAGGSPGLTD